MIQAEGDVARQLRKQQDLLVVEKIALVGVQNQNSHRTAADDQRQPRGGTNSALDQLVTEGEIRPVLDNVVADDDFLRPDAQRGQAGHHAVAAVQGDLQSVGEVLIITHGRHRPHHLRLRLDQADPGQRKMSLLDGKAARFPI